MKSLVAQVVLFASFAAVVPAAVETWTNLEGQSMEAEFIGLKGDQVSFKKADGVRYVYSYEKLSPEDRLRIDELAALAGPAPEETVPPPAPATPAPPARVGEVPAALAGKLVAVKNKRLASLPREQIRSARHVAFYYSAAWCGPCRAFTPDLVVAYREIKAKHPDFELVFVSSDRSEDDMLGYMSEYGMEWPALRFDQKKSARVVRRPDHERGIPNLVFMDADGKELSVSYTSDGDYRGPRSVLADIKKHYGL